MIIPPEILTQQERDHRYQAFRIKCLELAISGGARADNIIEIADKLSAYILTRSPAEQDMILKERELDAKHE